MVERVNNWAQKNLNLSEDKDAAKRKVAEFFKKSSVQGAVKSASEMTSSQAIRLIRHLTSIGDSDKADAFKDKFRKNAIEGKKEKYQQREENKREGGVIGKGIVGGLNIFVKVVVQPLAGVRDLGAKGINVFSGK